MSTFVRHDEPKEDGPRTPASSLLRGDRIWVDPHGWLTVHHVSLDAINARVHFEDGSPVPWRDYRPSNAPVQRQMAHLTREAILEALEVEREERTSQILAGLSSPMGRPGVYMAVGDDMAAPVAPVTARVAEIESWRAESNGGPPTVLPRTVAPDNDPGHEA